MDVKQKIDLLYKLKKEVEKSSNTLLVAQINEVIKKVYEDKKIISFVGHFSSGKSSLINKLLGEAILPSSPVPTTSNSAQITISAHEEIIVNLENHEYAVVEDYETVKKINTENQRIESVEIKHQAEHLAEGLTLQDTPGIDATFSNHEENTMKYLLTSDLIIYTVEYNHVESEKNFKEMQRLNALGVPLILVINQIDKHDETEVAFEDFKAAILSNINLWKIDLEILYFTSIYDHLLNQFDQLKKELMTDQQVLNASAAGFFKRIVPYITTEQLRFLEQTQKELLEQFGIDADGFEDFKAKALEQSQLSEEQAIFSDEQTTRDTFLKEIRDILKNAYIIPFEIREQIRELLEVYAPDYKVGGLFGKEKKREQLRNDKMDAVLTALNQSVDKQVNFHIRAFYQNYAKYTKDNSWIESCKDYTYSVTAEDLRAQMKSQALINNDYVQNYTDQLKKFIEQDVVRDNRAIIADFIQQLDRSRVQSSGDSKQMKLLEQYEQNYELIDSLTTENYRHYYIHVDESIDKLIDRHLVTLTLQENAHEAQHVLTRKAAAETDIEQAVKTLGQFSGISYFSDITARLCQQLDRINNDVTRIVVFGAFSAGKSSLINALLGDKKLVSSPNPTTAAITEISYGRQHTMKFKTTAVLTAELNKIGRAVNINEPTIEGWLKTYDKVQPVLDNQHKKFIQALKENYHHYMTHLAEGDIIAISEEEVVKFTAVDAHSAFVDRIYLQYDIDFLRGKVIIDSPGIGSTNMRHTNETTEIIADSDLLIYVSYFNHVFTESDKAFISYLNELQVLSEDSETFYVINAIDLARNDAEIEQVTRYFESELAQLNVPATLFQLSSKQALAAQDDRFNDFKTAISRFAAVDSKTQKIQQFERGVNQLAAHADFIVQNFEAAKIEEAAHKAYYAKLASEPPFTAAVIDSSIDKAAQELNEQLTFLTDRFNIQLHDLIKTYYNRRTVDDSAGYLNHLSNRLEEELSMISPRLNHVFNQAVQNHSSLIRQDLLDHQIISSPAEMKLIQLAESFIDVKLGRIPVKVTARSYRTKETISELYERIHEESMQLLAAKLKDYQSAVSSYLNDRREAVTAEWTANNEQVLADIQERQSQQLDDRVVSQIRAAL
ncbi:hypothetical protein ERX35_004290 [Macrococcus equipercicus]|uniref:Dynamin N-terminal domain-containing protein n=1 Tax=Macrococcus equipercicus TaxID=69967 RepID=A0ABQ6RA95_9STAP|nr:dynamin family protein [Macrococcus equipercicus]KAA1040215.1 hypothetical protein ERX35_004290 [Macrococcus equipercicus]